VTITVERPSSPSDTWTHLARGASIAPIGALLVLSGTAGLIYQVAWVKLLGLTFGVTIFAISTVLAAFMAGLAIGSVVGGRRADQVRRPLFVYGLVELLIAITALLTPLVFGWLQGVYAAVAQVVDPSQAPLVAGSVRAVLAFAVLLAPTGLMGATLPLAVRGARASYSDEDVTSADARAIGVLYALNTTGAIVGCLLAGFYLIGRLGLAETIATAALCNALAGAGGLMLGRRRTASGSTHDQEQKHFGTDPSLARAAFWVLAASGLIALAYEVVWARILAILFDSSIYGFVLMLATVLFGIALGGALGGALVGWRTSSRLAGLTLGWLEIGIGLAAVLALVAFGGVYDLLISLRDGGPNVFARLLRTDPRLMAALCVTTVLPAALMMGATFPIGARLWAAGADRLGQRLGGVYAANVSGAILGSLLGGFVLVPLLGAHSSLMLLAAASVLVGVAMLMVVSRGAMPIVAGALALAAIAWGASRTPLHETVFHERFPDMQLVAYWEGLENTVSVALEPDGVQRLFTNSRSQTNDSPDLVRYHRVMGHLAAVLSPRDGPRTLVVGIGGGATPGAIAQHSGAEIDLIELSEAVVAAAPHFSVVSQDVLRQPNVHLQIDDGRNFLLRNRRLYDVITADVVPPFDAGATNLYSIEYFTLASKALAPDGIMVQWASPGSAYEHELIVRSFLQVFPHATLWLSGDLLVGSMTPQRFSPAELDARLADPKARASLAGVGFNRAQDVLAQYRGGTAELRAYAGDGPVLTDNRPLLEYFLSLPVEELQAPPDLSIFQGRTPPVVD
jgi:spermidine synthase